jgi:hypothetical protein
MSRKLSLTLVIAVLALLVAVPVFAGGPSFGPEIYGDGKAWGTKGLGELPAPNENMKGSFDRLFVFTNGADGQLPLSEAAPRNPAYNGGRWWVIVATWDAPHEPVVLTSYSSEYVDDPFYSFEFHYNLGHIEIEETSTYFECPLLPVK